MVVIFVFYNIWHNLFIHNLDNNIWLYTKKAEIVSKGHWHSILADAAGIQLHSSMNHDSLSLSFRLEIPRVRGQPHGFSVSTQLYSMNHDHLW